MTAARTSAEAPPKTVECARCEVAAFAVRGTLPSDWEVKDGRPYCPDCSQQISLAALAPPIAGHARLYPIGPDGETSRYRGCRLAHEIALGTVGLRIHAGVMPPNGERDDPVQFLLTTADLDQLISRLEVIQLELNAQRQPRDY